MLGRFLTMVVAVALIIGLLEQLFGASVDGSSHHLALAANPRQIVAQPTPTPPSSAPPTRTPTPRPTLTPTLGLGTQPTSGLPVQGDIFSPTPTLPVLVALPTSTPAPPPVAPVPFPTFNVPIVPIGDLVPVRVDVYQSVHRSLVSSDVDVPLVADKDSLVRVWVLMQGSQPPLYPWNVSVELRAFRDGQDLGPCGPATNDVQKVILEDVTLEDYELVTFGNLARTFNFHLPPSCPWVDAGFTTLRAKAYGPECTACLDNNTIEQTFQFFPIRPLKVRFHLLSYQGQTAEFTYAGLPYVLSQYPISSMDIQPIMWTIQVPDSIDLSGGAASSDEWWDQYVDLLIYLQGCCRSDDVDVDIGLLPLDIVGCAGVGGYGWAVTGPGCGATYVHEIGHAFALAHSSDSHGECDGGGCDPDWPFTHGRIDGYGWDILQPEKLIVPAFGGSHSHDTMSYGVCGADAPTYDEANPNWNYCAIWLSTLNYGRIGQRLWCFFPQWDIEQGWFGFPLFAFQCYSLPWPLGGPFALLLTDAYGDLFGSPAPQPGSAPASSSSAGDAFVTTALQDTTASESARLRLSGSISAAGVVELRPGYQLPAETGALTASSSVPRNGEYRVELQDEQGDVVVLGSFNPSPVFAHAPVRGSTFEGTVPWDRTARRIVIQQGDEIVAEREVSPNPPRVRLLVPTGGENFAPGGALAVSWEAEDPDGDILAYWLQYSGDDGRTWTTVFRDLTATSYTLDLDRLPASGQARVRVLATDGVNTAVDESGTFAVAGGTALIGPFPQRAVVTEGQ